MLSSTQGIDTLRENEMMVASQIKTKLSSQDAALFNELWNNLKDGVCYIVNNNDKHFLM